MSVPRITGTTIAEDPIGAFSGIRYRDTLIYATYRTTGFALRTPSGIHNRVATEPVSPRPDTTSSQTRNANAAIPGTTESYAGSRNTIVDTALENDRYYDLPRPVFWFPLAALRGGTDRDISADFGIYALAASTLEQHELELTALYSPTLVNRGDPSPTGTHRGRLRGRSPRNGSSIPMKRGRIPPEIRPAGGMR